MKINDKYFLNPAHEEIYKARYALKDKSGELIETDIYDTFKRVVDYIYLNDKDNAKEALKYRVEKKIVDAGRPLAQAGTKTRNLQNCFVIGFKDDTREAISELKRQHFNIQSHGGGTGINFSSLRPNGSICETTQSRSSGAIGFITDISYQSSNVQQNGNRSGANLGVLEDWHPDLYEFITKKSSSNWEKIRDFASIASEDQFSYFQWNNPYPWQMFNVSVLLSDKFMDSINVGGNEEWQLYWKDTNWYMWDFENTVGPKTSKEFVKKITVTAPNENMALYKASAQIPYFNNKELRLIRGPYNMTTLQWFNLICKNAWEDGCPGIIFIDRARKFHNGEYFNKISACNPCGEQLLPINSSCNLSSLSLPSFYEFGEFNFDDFGTAIRQAVRGLDNIIDINYVGEDEIDQNIKLERRIGLGTTGIAELLIMMGIKYSSDLGRKTVEKILMFLRDTAYLASVELAKEKGPFSAFDFHNYSKSHFFKTLPQNIKNEIKENGIRNVTILTQAPVGSTGTMIGFSTGCEPYFAMAYHRNSRVGSFLDGSPTFNMWLKENKISYGDFGFSLLELKKHIEVPDYFEEAHEISWEDHIKMQAVFSKYIDASISKTINMPSYSTIDDVKKAYLMAYNFGIKSTTVYRDGSKQQILERLDKKQKNNKIFDGTMERPAELKCDIHHTTVKGERWTVLVGLMEEKPYEIFVAPQGSFEISPKYKNGMIVKSGKGSYYLDAGDFKLKDLSGCLQTDEHRVITRLISTCLRHGVPMKFIAEQLAKADGTVVDMSKAILRVLKKYDETDASEEQGDQRSDVKCDKCGGTRIVLQSGCSDCLDCGSSKCG